MRALVGLAIVAGILPAQTLEERIARIADQMQPRLVECRRDIHMHPELSGQEERTGKLVAERLRALGLEDVKTGIAGNGVTGVVRGGKPGPVVAWRAEMDALPIDESSLDVPYKSTVKGVKHACGHDAHVTIALGLAEALMQVKADLPGTVKFIFQPAEEGANGAKEWGAKLMIAQGALENPKPQAIYAFHVGAHAKAGQVAVTSGPASSMSTSFGITFTGKRAHGAYPYQGIDAVAVASQCIVALQTIHSRRVSTQNPSVFSIGTIQGGERRNVIAETVKVAGTLRTFSADITDQYEKLVRQTLDGCTSAMEASYKLDFRRGYPPMVNDPGLVRGAAPAIERVLGKGNLLDITAGMFAEDFSYFQREIPGVQFGLGVRNDAKKITASVHTAEFDIDEEILAIGVKTGAAIVLNYMTGGAK